MVFLLIRLHLFSKKYPRSNSREAIHARLDRFEKFCLPTLRRQISPNFKALLIMDERAPLDVCLRASQYADSRNIFLEMADNKFANNGDMFEDPALPLACQDIIARHLDDADEVVVTTMLDSDDALHPEFVAKLHDEIRPGVCEYLVFDTFYCHTQFGIAQAARNKGNMFHTLVEPRDGFQTCFVKKHGYIAEYAPIRLIGNGIPYCMKYYHSENLDSGMKSHASLPVEEIMETFYG